MTDPIAWLNAQLDADEKEVAGDGKWLQMHPGDPVRIASADRIVEAINWRLADVTAKRKILALHHEYYGVCPHCVEVGPDRYDRETWPCRTIRLLLSIYADRPGWREEWR